MTDLALVKDMGKAVHVFLSCQKAFDSILHRRLIKMKKKSRQENSRAGTLLMDRKLPTLGNRGHVLEVPFQTWSKYCTVPRGVPQGPVWSRCYSWTVTSLARGSRILTVYVCI